MTVFVASLLNPHFAAAMQGALDAFEGSRYRLMFTQTGYVDGLQADITETIRPFGPAAVIFTGIPMRAEAREALRQLEMPVMELWSGDAEPIDMVAGASIQAGARLMGEHFVRAGLPAHRLCRPDQSCRAASASPVSARVSRKRAASLGYILAIEGTGTSVGGHRRARPTSSRDYPECDAIYFGSDLLAVGAQIAARESGIELPRRMAMAGYGDLEFARHLTPGPDHGRGIGLRDGPPGGA